MDFVNRSMICCAPLVTSTPSSSVPMLREDFMYSLRCCKSGGEPSVVLYWSAKIGSSSISFAEMAASCLDGNASGAGLPAESET